MGGGGTSAASSAKSDSSNSFGNDVYNYGGISPAQPPLSAAANNPVWLIPVLIGVAGIILTLLLHRK